MRRTQHHFSNISGKKKKKKRSQPGYNLIIKGKYQTKRNLENFHNVPSKMSRSWKSSRNGGILSDWRSLGRYDNWEQCPKLDLFVIRTLLELAKFELGVLKNGI